MQRVRSISSVTIYRFTDSQSPLQCSVRQLNNHSPILIILVTSWDDYTLKKKENEIFLIFKDIQMGSGAKSYMRKGFLIYEEMRKYFTIYEEAVTVSHI